MSTKNSWEKSMSKINLFHVVANVYKHFFLKYMYHLIVKYIVISLPVWCLESDAPISLISLPVWTFRIGLYQTIQFIIFNHNQSIYVSTATVSRIRPFADMALHDVINKHQTDVINARRTSAACHAKCVPLQGCRLMSADCDGLILLQIFILYLMKMRIVIHAICWMAFGARLPWEEVIIWCTDEIILL